MNNIKGKELCERCERCKVYKNSFDEKRKRQVVDENFLDCSKIKKNTPCPFFDEKKEDF